MEKGWLWKECSRCLWKEAGRKFHITNGIISFFIVFSVAKIPLYFLPNIEWALPWISFFERLTVTLFTAEYVLRIWTARRPFKYIFSFMGLVDLFAILPFYLLRFGLISSFGTALGLRVLRFFKFGRMHNREQIAIQNTTVSGQDYGLFRPVGDEQVQRVIQRHPITFIVGMVLPLIFMSFALIATVYFFRNWVGIVSSFATFFVGGMLFYKVWLDYSYDVMIITNRRVVVQDAEIFGMKSNDLNYYSITNVVPNNRGMYHWLFNKGNIRIETASHKGDLSFCDAPDPYSVVRRISENRQKVHRARERKELQEIT